MVDKNIGTPGILMKQAGFTIIELVVVVTVIGIIATVSFFGLKNFNANQDVINAQKEFMSGLRTMQNKASTGGAGANIAEVYINTLSGQNYYRLGKTSAPIYLTKGVTIKPYLVSSALYPTYLHICFANQALVGYDSKNKCSGCTETRSDYFACRASGDPGTQPVDDDQIRIEFVKSGAETKSVYVEGTGMRITSIHD